MKRDGGPAFPQRPPRGVFPPGERAEVMRIGGGMTLRDYFAGQALAECIRVAADQTPEPLPMLSDLFDKAATYAYYAADAMLAQREKP